jgi:glycosyltransferase involved in cell wall biosynthesis
MHVVKTSEGAPWAAAQAAELVRAGVEVHAVLPHERGSMIESWQNSGARLHFRYLDFPARAPWKLHAVLAGARALIEEIRPDLVHTHHVGPTLVIRGAMGDHGPRRVYQVAGPLHLEHALYRRWELLTSTRSDFWIASSAYIASLYRRHGIAADRIFVSYHGMRPEEFCTARTDSLRGVLGIPPHHRVVGNVNHIYPPKYHVGQFIGLKAHEDLIDALALVVEARSDVTGVLIGGVWGRAPRYERTLRARAAAAGRGRILMPGHFSATEVARFWADCDCAIHVPISENCGGVVEPLLAAVPTIAGRVGGLREVVLDGLTGRTVPIRKPRVLADAVLAALENEESYRRLARNGQKLVRTMFDIRRTSREVHAIYRHLLDPAYLRPPFFHSRKFAEAGFEENRDAVVVG